MAQGDCYLKILEKGSSPWANICLGPCLGATELSIVKCYAQQKGEGKITLGNNFADQTAKAAAKRETEPGKGFLVLTRA